MPELPRPDGPDLVAQARARSWAAAANELDRRANVRSAVEPDAADSVTDPSSREGRFDRLELGVHPDEHPDLGCRRAPRRQPAQPGQPLPERAGVLVLVDAEPALSGADRGCRLAIVLEQADGLAEHVVEVDPARPGLGPLVVTEDADEEVNRDRRLAVGCFGCV